MADMDLPRPDPQAFDNLMRRQALTLRGREQPPANLADWQQRRDSLRKAMFAAMGTFPDKPCPLEPRELGVLKRDGYRIEKLLLQTRPDVWMTASCYIPEPVTGKRPAVLVVHGHWPWARRDPVVQARCLGLVKLGFVVLAVDAFGAGERYTKPDRGTYHGALYGSTLWPTGQTLLGMQVYDNRRAVDYLQSRSEVDGTRLGITGASGGGNQSMYAGALDERFKAVVPVCSVGTYQAYLHAACCVCEVLPSALRFTEEGEVLALVAPRALLVINATKDGFQFSVGEAEKSLARARPMFALHGVEMNLRHGIFESPHAYNQQMRELMYGWMKLHLLGEGDGSSIPEPKHEIEKVEDLACFPNGEHPAGFLFPPSFAGREGRALTAVHDARMPVHGEAWEATAVYMRTQLRKQVFGEFPRAPQPTAQMGKTERVEGVVTTPLVLEVEPSLALHAVVRLKPAGQGLNPACVLLHLDGKAKALEHPLAKTLTEQGWLLLAPDLRATGESAAANGGIRHAPDHNSAEHALWVGRPLLGQWVFDVICLLDWLATHPSLDRNRLAVIGLGQAGVVAVCAAGLDDRITTVGLVDPLTTFVTEQPYAENTRMGLLAPGLLKVGDIPHLAALAVPRRLTVSGGVTPQGTRLDKQKLQAAFGFTAGVYKVLRASNRLTVAEGLSAQEVVNSL